MTLNQKEPNKKYDMKERRIIMKKVIVAMMLMAMTATTVAGCGSNDTAADTTTETAADTAAAGAISVLSREDGSGTRGAFIELFGIEQKDADGDIIFHISKVF